MITPSNLSFLLKHKTLLIAIASIVTVAKLLSTIAIMYLPISSLEFTPTKESENYFFFNFPRAISISTEVIEVVKVQEKIVPTATMNSFTLKAIYAQDNGGGFILLLNKKTSKSDLVSKNETYEGYLLKTILSKKVIFTKNGTEYELRLNDEKTEEIKTISEITPKKIINTVQTVDRVDRNEIKKYRKNLSLAAKDIRVSPYKENGEIIGFKITRVKRGSIFEKLGIQKGDIALTANGVSLTSPKNALKLYKQIDKIKVFKMVIRRNGLEKELEYEIY